MHKRHCRTGLRRGSLACALALLVCGPGARADEAARVAYQDMCVHQATGIPAPMGESDLKGHPSLKIYCGCVAAAFEERALQRRQQGGPQPSLQQSVQEERDLRSACRAKLNMPPLPARSVPQ